VETEFRISINKDSQEVKEGEKKNIEIVESNISNMKERLLHIESVIECAFSSENLIMDFNFAIPITLSSVEIAEESINRRVNGGSIVKLNEEIRLTPRKQENSLMLAIAAAVSERSEIVTNVVCGCYITLKTSTFIFGSALGILISAYDCMKVTLGGCGVVKKDGIKDKTFSTATDPEGNTITHYAVVISNLKRINDLPLEKLNQKNKILLFILLQLRDMVAWWTK
jgi:hypothetical protein